MSYLSQKDLAEKLGISPSTLNGYEKGNHDPKSIGLIRIAQICNVTTDFLLGLTDNPYRVVSSHDDVDITDDNDEKILLSKYRVLNDEGKKKLNERADELHSLGYIKEDMEKMA